MVTISKIPTEVPTVFEVSSYVGFLIRPDWLSEVIGQSSTRLVVGHESTLAIVVGLLCQCESNDVSVCTPTKGI